MKNTRFYYSTNRDFKKRPEKREDETKVGDEIAIYFFKGPKGNLPIGRTEKGKIVLIHRKNPEDKIYVPYGSSQLCRVVAVEPSKILVDILYEIASAEENNKDMSEGLSNLKNSKI